MSSGSRNCVCKYFCQSVFYQLDFLHSGNVGTRGRSKEKAEGLRRCIQWLLLCLGLRHNKQAPECNILLTAHSGILSLRESTKSRIISANIHVFVLSSLAVLLFVFADWKQKSVLRYNKHILVQPLTMFWMSDGVKKYFSRLQSFFCSKLRTLRFWRHETGFRRWRAKAAC